MSIEWPRQIIPADGWLAAFALDDGEDGFFTERVALWAICAGQEYNPVGRNYDAINEQETMIYGFTAGEDVTQCEEDNNFVCYVHEKELEARREMISEMASDLQQSLKEQR